MNPNDDRHLFEILTDLEQGSTGAHLNDMLPAYDDYDQMDNAFYDAIIGADDQYICYVPRCRRGLNPFRTLRSLREHIRNCHTPEEYYQYYTEPREREREAALGVIQERCPHCNKLFDNRGRNLNRHIRDVHGPRNLQCTYEGCESVFSSERLRRDHIRLVHQDVQEFCRVPGCRRIRSFPSRKVLQQHMKQVHSEQEYLQYYENLFR
jgi:hypothetical protein